MEKWYWLILIGVLVVVYVLMIARQKRQEKKSIEVLNSFKVGDKVITHIGIYGKIKRIYNTSFGKTCVLEIGNTNKIDIEIDMRYIAGLDEKVLVADDAKTEPAVEPKTTEEPKLESDEKSQEEQLPEKQTEVNNSSNEAAKKEKSSKSVKQKKKNSTKK